MNYKIIISPIASQNIEDAVEYYIYKVKKKVAIDFFKRFSKSIQSTTNQSVLSIS